MAELAVAISLVGLAFHAVVVVFVMLGYFRRFATKDDIKGLNDRLIKLESGQSDLKAGLSALEARQGAFETQFQNHDGNLREIGRKADASLDLHKTVQADLIVLQASVNRLDSYFETPKLKSP